jgi:NAD(P)-dependent dehydrogenase (short-subunit alcohol dehydrogenase family)
MQDSHAVQIQAALSHKVQLQPGQARPQHHEFTEVQFSQPAQPPYCQCHYDRSVIATCRDPDSAAGLHELASQHGERLQVVQLDVTSENSIQVGVFGHLPFAASAIEWSRALMSCRPQVVFNNSHYPAFVSEQAAAKAVSTQHGHLDLLVNVAGVLHIPGELSPGTA